MEKDSDEYEGGHRGDEEDWAKHDWDDKDHHGRGWHHGGGQDDDKLWHPKHGDQDSMGDTGQQTGDENGESGEEDGMSNGMKLKIIAATVVAAVVLIVALIIIIVVCCKKKSRKAAIETSTLKKKNPFQDPEKAAQPSLKEIEARQSAPPMMHTLPIVIRPGVDLHPIPSGQRGGEKDYTAPPPVEDPRADMALWSPPPAYEEPMPQAD